MLDLNLHLGATKPQVWLGCCCYCCVPTDGVSLCHPGCPGTFFGHQAGLELTASASYMLRYGYASPCLA